MSPTSRLVLATRNAHKVSELRRILAGLGGLEIVGVDAFADVPDVAETGVTFPDEHRAAWFACAAALALPDGTERVAHGRLDGHVARAPRGSGGFGYDPIFVPDDSENPGGTRTLAEYGPEEKDAISHRGRAFGALAPAVEQVLAAARVS
jgi:inosine/xanthosine triphosphate pyrophosphatase family protein